MSASTNTKLLPAYLAVGSDELKIRQVMLRMDKRLLEAGGDLDFDRQIFEGASLGDPELLRSHLDTLSFLSSFRLVVIRDVDTCSRTVTDMLVDYLASPNPDVVVLMSAHNLAKTTRLYKALVSLGPQAIISCDSKKRYELSTHVIDMAKSHGLSLDAEAAELLIKLVGTSTLQLDNELSKLSIAVSGHSVHSDDVLRLVERSTAPAPWDLSEALAKRDLAAAIHILSLFEETSLYPAFSYVVSFMKELLVTKVLDEENRMTDLADEIGRLRGRKVQAWQIKNHVRWSRNFSKDELVRIVCTAPDCDEAMKNSPDKSLAFISWVLGITSSQYNVMC